MVALIKGYLLLLLLLLLCYICYDHTPVLTMERWGSGEEGIQQAVPCSRP